MLTSINIRKSGKVIKILTKFNNPFGVVSIAKIKDIIDKRFISGYI